MAITDELREWKGNIIADLRPEMVLTLRRQLNSIADRIDAEHERMFRSLTIDAEPMTDESMAEHGWVRLPVDADGVPIRPGDELVIFETGEHIRAYDVELYDDGRWCVCDYETMDSINPDRLRHRALTVEDVLREFAEKITDSQIPSVHPTYEEAIVEYAAKLRLAGEE